MLDRHAASRHRLIDAPGVAADQRQQRPRLAGEYQGERREVLALAVTAGDQHHRRQSMPAKRRHRGADVGALESS